MLTLSLALPSLGSQPPVGGEDGMQRGAAGVLAGVLVGHVGFAGVLVGLLAGHVGFAGVLVGLLAGHVGFAGVLAVLEDMLAMKKLLV